MDREEIKNRIFQFFKQAVERPRRPGEQQQIQMGILNSIFEEQLRTTPSHKRDELLSSAREVVQELINNGLLYPGLPNDQNSSYPWLTITEYGKEVFIRDTSLPYDPDGYLKALKSKITNIDDVTLAYIGESVSTFNRRQLLSATLTLGVASENLMLLLIEEYINWIKDPKRKAALDKKVRDKFIYTQYKEFKKEFATDVATLPKELQGDWETYLDGVFNFIRLNRNSVGHPTGKELNAKVAFANLQIFADYARYIYDLIEHFEAH